MNLRRRWHGIFMTFKIPVVELRLPYSYEVKKSSDLAGAQVIIEDWISSIHTVVKLTDQLTETKKTCLTHKN